MIEENNNNIDPSSELEFPEKIDLNAKSKILSSFLESNLSIDNTTLKVEDYRKSQQQLSTYKNIFGEDKEFLKLVKEKYGSIENFFLINSALMRNRVYDPFTDYEMEVSIITKEFNLTTNFISAQEMFLETLSGISSIYYFKKNGNIARMTMTLKKSLIPDTEHETRNYALASFGGKKILVWDVNKDDWSSFYIQNVKRFVRDDTSDLE